MNVLLNSRPLRFLGIMVVAMLAACAAIFFLNLLAPPRSLVALQPTREATRRPAPTITPVAYPPTPPIALKDDLTTHDNFPRSVGTRVPFGYAEDSYRLAPPLDPGFVRVLNQNFQDKTYLNLTLDAKAAPAPDSADVEYGVVFWHSQDEAGNERFLAFTVSTKSAVRLLAIEPVTSTVTNTLAYKISEVIPATHSAEIHVDGTPNQLRVDVHPRRLLAYVNDELVIDTDAKIISEWRLRRDFDGQVGMIALTQDPGADVRFTQFDIYADSQKQP